MSRSTHRNKQQKLYLFMVFLFLISIAISLMPLAGRISENSTMPHVIVGIILWIGVIGTTVMALVINSARKRDPAFNHEFRHKRKLGLIHFLQNRPAVFADIVMVLSLAATIVFLVLALNKKTDLPFFVSLAVFVFFFGMHCMLNGINYMYISFRKRKVPKS